MEGREEGYAKSRQWLTWREYLSGQWMSISVTSMSWTIRGTETVSLDHSTSALGLLL